MAMTERSKGILTGIAVGIGVALVAKYFGKPIKEAARPLAKAGMRSLVEARERGEELLAEAAESLSDIAAEVRAEREATRAEAVAAARTSVGPTEQEAKA
jgi:hypothetical protein